MRYLLEHRWLLTGLLAITALALLIVWQVLYIMLHYTASVPAPDVPRTAERFGTSGPKLKFVVLGDSTSIGQGAQYEQGIARGSARYLARSHQVELTNLGVSGARVADVRSEQLAKAVKFQPDLVLIAIGANDVTHYTRLGSVRTNVAAIITQLQTANSQVQIILTGSPAMGSVARFAPPTQWLAGKRTLQINAVFADVAQQKHVTLLPLAAKTGYAFKHDLSLYAPDNFHPNAAGYALWRAVVNDGLDEVMSPVPMESH